MPTPRLPLLRKQVPSQSLSQCSVMDISLPILICIFLSYLMSRKSKLQVVEMGLVKQANKKFSHSSLSVPITIAAGNWHPPVCQRLRKHTRNDPACLRMRKHRIQQETLWLKHRESHQILRLEVGTGKQKILSATPHLPKRKHHVVKNGAEETSLG